MWSGLNLRAEHPLQIILEGDLFPIQFLPDLLPFAFFLLSTLSAGDKHLRIIHRACFAPYDMSARVRPQLDESQITVKMNSSLEFTFSTLRVLSLSIKYLFGNEVD